MDFVAISTDSERIGICYVASYCSLVSNWLVPSTVVSSLCFWSRNSVVKGCIYILPFALSILVLESKYCSHISVIAFFPVTTNNLIGYRCLIFVRDAVARLFTVSVVIRIGYFVDGVVNIYYILSCICSDGLTSTVNAIQDIVLSVISGLSGVVINWITISSSCCYLSALILNHSFVSIFIEVMDFVREISALGVVKIDNIKTIGLFAVIILDITHLEGNVCWNDFVVTVNIDCLLGYLITKGLVVYSFSLMENSIGVFLEVINSVRNIPHNNQDV